VTRKDSGSKSSDVGRHKASEQPVSEAAESAADEPISNLDGVPDEADELIDETIPGALTEPVDLTVEARAHGWRLDHYLSRIFANHSRAQFQKAIEAGAVMLNGLPARPSRRLRVSDRIHVSLPDSEEGNLIPEDIPISVLYEDESLIVVNKQANLVVHPGRGNPKGTLAAGLQFHFNQLSSVAGRHRPGIVHRLDRDTSGVILVAKDNQVHQKLSAQFEQREVKKEYRAIVRGVPELRSDYIRTHIRVHPRVREKMMVCPEGGNAREAVSFYKTAETFFDNRYALIELFPSTGRTHQLRVHMLHIGCPIVADRMYAGQSCLRKSDLIRLQAEGPDDMVLIDRQALHAFRLTFRHPVSGKEMQFEAPFPEDFDRTLRFLRSL
jgi:23S rRNA pseudouridine1911/1915/1917 synthase